MKKQMTVIPSRHTNYLRVEGMGDTTMDVGNFTDEEAAEYWDERRVTWLAHVSERRANLAEDG